MNDHVIAETTQDRTEPLESVHSFPGPLSTARTGEAERSAGEVTAHFALAEQGIVAIPHRLPEREKGGESNGRERKEMTVTRPSLHTEKIRASRRATPEHPFSKSKATAVIVAMRQTRQEIIEKSFPYNLHKRIFSHIILGDLNFHQRARFIGARARRHTAQIARIRTTPDANA